jgi:hypothetical protein
MSTLITLHPRSLAVLERYFTPILDTIGEVSTTLPLTGPVAGICSMDVASLLPLRQQQQQQPTI